MRRCAGLIAAALLLTAAAVVTPVPDGGSDAQSVTVGASWLQRQRDDHVVDEVVHSLDDFDEQTTAGPQYPNNVSMQCMVDSPVDPFSGFSPHSSFPFPFLSHTLYQRTDLAYRQPICTFETHHRSERLGQSA